jgi:thioredoxin reductase (NADPH)
MPCRKSGYTWKVDAQHMFLFIGTDPNTQWLDRRIALDNKGRLLTQLGRSHFRSADAPSGTQ